MQKRDLRRVFAGDRIIIGMVHLGALPGAPAYESMAAVLERARRDAHALADGGVHGIMIENFGDAPFFPDRVPAETVAAVARLVAEVRRQTALPLGVNVLRNDARAALGIAAACDAQFIRVNVHTGSMLTDQGWVTGMAHETLRLREALRADVAILADVFVKHAVAPPGLTLADAARDSSERGLADALIVSGAATGMPTAATDVAAVRRAAPDVPVLIGSGLTVDNAHDLLRAADGAIIGSAFQHDGRAGRPVDPRRVAELMRTITSA
jgi:uncharacterized protein